MIATINVTQNCINYGGTKASNCPVTLAAMTAGFRKPKTGRNAMSVTNADGQRMKATLPPNIVQVLRDYDHQVPMTPVRFSLEFRPGEGLDNL